MPNELQFASLAIGGLAQIVEAIAKNLGKSTDEVLKDVAADCAKRAADPSDDSDKARAEMEADLPGAPEPPTSSQR